MESELRSMMEPTLGKAGFKAGISGCMKRRLFKVEKVDKKTNASLVRLTSNLAMILLKL